MAMSALMVDLADAFHQDFPLVTLDVTSLGTQFGLDALSRGEVDLAMISWLSPDPDPGWRTTAVARDGLSIIVHPSNPIDGLGLLQLQDLFSGRVSEWEAVTGGTVSGQVQPVEKQVQLARKQVQPLSREEGAGTRAAFEALVMKDRPVTPWALVAPSSQAVVEYVARDPEAIGYVSMGYVSEEVKVLKIEGVLPTPETAGSGSYPLTRELWLVASEPPSEAVQAFLDFVLSPAGQRVVGRSYGRVK
jgi:phosphate transport system substrate-binding protein